MNDVVIVSAARTPIGSYLGSLRDVAAYDLAALVLDAVVKKIGLEPAGVDEERKPVLVSDRADLT